MKENNPFFQDLAFNLEALNQNTQDITEDLEKYLAGDDQYLKDELVEENTETNEEEDELNRCLSNGVRPIWVFMTAYS